jgi:ATP-binding cassette subfamily B protein
MSESYHIEDEVQKRSYDSQLMKRLLIYIQPYKFAMIFATLLLLVAAVLGNFAPFLTMHAIDTYVNNPTQLENTPGGEDSGVDSPTLTTAKEADKRGLRLIVLLMFGVGLADFLTRSVQSIIVAWVGNRTMFEMRFRLLEHLQKMSLQFLDKNPVGRLMSRVTSDVERIQENIVGGMVQIVSDLVSLAVVMAFMFYVNWKLTLVVLSPVPLVIMTSVVFRKYASNSFLEIRKKIAHVSANLQENLTGMRIVQLFCREDDRYDTFQDLNKAHRNEWLRQVYNFAVYFPLIDFFGTLSAALIILYIGFNRHQLDVPLIGLTTVGTFFGFVQWSERIFGPIRGLAERYNMLLEAMASSERVFQLHDTPEDIQNRPDCIVPATPDTQTDNSPVIEGHVEFRNVSFAYKPGLWVLKDIELAIKPGERVAIVGHTGAGKSTIINLLSRFYDVQQGAVLIDGIDVRDYEKIALRQNIGIVLQDVFLFAGTIEDNIRLGDLSMTDAWIQQCAEYVNAAKFIEKLPEGYQYHVGERGCNLSTGQRQLLAFARTLAHKPRILILDEATSSIDTETEHLIQDALAKLLESDGYDMADDVSEQHRRTSIVIAHRLSTIQHADRIVVMHHGEIREVGTHQQLLAQGGLYRTLYELQYKDQSVS